MIMAIWLIAWAVNKKLPAPAIYVVDRRTVVDQATEVAEMLVHAPVTKWMYDAFGDQMPAITTLRGQLADNREWSRDPSRPAIIIGTVDLIGSALLFSGYRSSMKRRPLEAGLLGQDSLLVLDKAHLSKPFEKLINSISDFQNRNDMPIRAIRMSATSSEESSATVFKLDMDPDSSTFDLWSKIESGRQTNPVKQRFEAGKRLTITRSTDVVDTVATEAGKLAVQHPGARIVIFVKSPRTVQAVRKSLIKKDKLRKPRSPNSREPCEGWSVTNW